MLGWWVDEAKGYHLEDLENGKLIASRDVHFHEDDLPSELAVIEVGDPPANATEINNPINDAITKDSTSLLVLKNDLSPMNSPSSPNIFPSNSSKENAPNTKTALDDLSNISSLPILCCSGRERKVPSCFALTSIDDTSIHGNVNIAFIAIAGEPKTYQETIQSPHSKQWEQAVKSEYAQLQKLGVFEVVDGLPKGRKAIGSCIVFREKHDRHGNLMKFKARILAKGFSQIAREDFTNTFSSVAKFSTLHIVLSYVAHLDWHLHHFNIVAAYLHGPLDEDIYMTIPNGVENSGSNHYWKLKKALYGLKQAGRQWKKCLHEVLVSFGFIWVLADDCLYIKRHKGKIILLVLVYVDNMAVARPDNIHIVSFKSFLSKDFEITDLGELQHILGILVSQDCTKCLIYLNQTAYIQQMVARFSIKVSCSQFW